MKAIFRTVTTFVGAAFFSGALSITLGASPARAGGSKAAERPTHARAPGKKSPPPAKSKSKPAIPPKKGDKGGSGSKPVSATLAPKPASAAGLPELTELTAEPVIKTTEGLRVILAPDPLASTVVTTLVLDVGSSDDPVASPGMAARLVEQLGQTSASGALLERGGRETSSVGIDRSSFTVVVPPHELGLAVFAQQERLRGKGLTDRARDGQARVRLADRAAESRGHDALAALVFQGAPAYEHPRFGPIAASPSTDVGDLETFGLSRVRWEGAVLVVAGQFDPARARTLLNSPIGRKEAPRPDESKVELHEQTNQRMGDIVDENAPPTLLFGWAIPGQDAPFSERAPFELARTLLAAPGSGRLATLLGDHAKVRVLVEEGRAASLFELRIDLDRGENLAEARKRVETALAQLGKDPVLDAELDRARRRAFQASAERIDDLELRALALAQEAAPITTVRAALLSVDGKVVRDLFQNRLGPLSRSVVSLGPATALARPAPQARPTGSTIKGASSSVNDPAKTVPSTKPGPAAKPSLGGKSPPPAKTGAPSPSSAPHHPAKKKAAP